MERKIIYPVECPLLNYKKIADFVCLEIHTVVDETAPKVIAPEEIFLKENYREICMNCQWHRDD